MSDVRSDLRFVYLKPNAIAEPLVHHWYAWSYLISPATAAMIVTHSHLNILASFLEAPHVHQTALQDPAMRGGPFINLDDRAIPAIQTLFDQTQQQTHSRALAAAIQALDALLQSATGYSLEPLYAEIPAPLKGYVELIYDRHNHASFRLIEPLLYRSEYYQESQQAIALSLGNVDGRSFVLSTPRFPDATHLHLAVPFRDRRWDVLFQMRQTPGDAAALAEQFGLNSLELNCFAALFTPEPPPIAPPYDGEGLRLRYFGHACVLLETAEVSILCDPLISYDTPTGMPRYSFADLPATIDYAVITHNHQDHVMLETLLQLRHKIRHIVIPKGNKGVLIDPSLKLALAAIGFTNILELDELDAIELPHGRLTAVPVLGEHGDLNIATKTAYWITLHGNSILCAADSNNIDPRLYLHLQMLLGNLDVLFIGMECDGAPYTWAYGSLLPPTLSAKMAQTRRLDGSNADRALQLVEQLQPQQVYVYAMGQEPWLTYITSIEYQPDSRPIVESDRLIAACRQQGRLSQRLLGAWETVLEPRSRPASVSRRLPASATLPIVADSNFVPQVAAAPAPLPESPNRKIAQFLAQLADRDIKLWVEPDGTTPKLKCNAPKGALTPDLQAELKTYKAEIIQFLSGRSPKPTLDLAADAVLDPRIQPDPHQPPTHSAQQILLTGATGFLGAFLLAELIQQTSATIHCLVRAETLDAAHQRLQRSLENYQLWQPEMRDRIRPMLGDLAQPQFGLPPEQWQTLVTNIDAIYHNGAWVHHTLPYSSLKAANVDGTVTVLALACQGRQKPVHYTSTLSVFAPTSTATQPIRETDRPDSQRLPSGGYAQTKWVAEQLVTQAGDRGLPVTIYRVGAVSGDSQTGVFNPNDFLYRLIQGCIQLQVAPIVDLRLDLLPADYVGRVMVRLAQRSELWGTVFHLEHPQAVTVERLFEALRELGYPIKRISYQEWRTILLDIADRHPDHPLYPIISLFSVHRSDAEPAPVPVRFDCQNALRALATEAIACPPLDKTLFQTYVNYLVQSACLPAANLITAPLIQA
jgi:thioester reductase-like protein